MSTLTAVVDTYSTVLAQTAPAPAGAGSGDQIATNIRNFIAPFFLLGLGLAALSFLWKRQMMEFFQFFLIGLLVAVLFYFPGVMEKLAGTVSGWF